MQQNRIYFMDSMRSVLMMLGVVIHTAQVFNPRALWIISSNNTNALMGHLVSFIHLYRMPAFFLVSGFFCMLTLRKYSVKKFVKLRFERLVIPFLATALTVNPLVALICHLVGVKPFILGEYFTTGRYIAHLWFLVYLAIYFGVALGIAVYAPRIARIAKKLLYTFCILLPLCVALACMPLLLFGVMGLNKIGFPLYNNFGGLFSFWGLFSYAPYFFFGAFLFEHKSFFQKFSSGGTFCGLAGFAVILYFGKSMLPGGSMLAEAVSIYQVWFYGWLGAAGCFFFFRKFANFPSKTFFFLSDASYTVYLFHYILVVIFGLAAIALDVPAIPGFLCIVAVVSVLSIVIHKYFILRFAVARYLFNGKRASRFVSGESVPQPAGRAGSSSDERGAADVSNMSD